YRSYLNEHGWPKTHGVDWAPFFTPQYYKRKIPVWTTYDPTGMLGEVEARSPRLFDVVLWGLVIGVLLGLFIVLGRLFFRRA
ncbi:MAG: hypothetical protein AB7P69_00975, partial [Candidatus Binatia bacterium]